MDLWMYWVRDEGSEEGEIAKKGRRVKEFGVSVSVGIGAGPGAGVGKAKDVQGGMRIGS